MNRWQYFTDDELRCKCGCNQMKMDSAFMQKVVGMRAVMDVPFIVTSGYRCKEYDDSLRGHGNHTTGRAIDILITGMAENKQIQLLEEAIRHNCRGLGIDDKKDHFIHIDNLRARLWTY